MFKTLREDQTVWQVTHTRTEAANGEMIDTYGISANGTAINDISVNKEEIEKFVRTLNRLGVSEIHAYDVVEDFLGR